MCTNLQLMSANGGIVLDLDEVNWGEQITSIHLDLVIKVSAEMNTLAEGRRLREELRQSAQRLRVRQHILDSQKKRIDEGDIRLEILEKKIRRSSTTTLGRLLSRFGLMRKFKV